MGGIFKKMLFDQAKALKALKEYEGDRFYREAMDEAARDYVTGVVQDVLNTPVEIEIRLEPGAKMPTQPYPTDACWDLYVSRAIEIPPHATVLVPSGVYIDVPEGYRGTFILRSGLGKKGLSVHVSAFDAGYQGELSAFVHNRTDEVFLFEQSDRVVQFGLRRKVSIVWKAVEELTPSARGTKGHGSSGR